MDVRLDFAELGDLDPIGNRYADRGLTFSSNAVSLIDRQAGGQGNFEIAEETGDRTILTYTDGDAIEVGVNNSLPAIVSGQLTLRYTSPHLNHAVEIRDGNGTLLQTTLLPKTAPNFGGGSEFGNFQTVVLDFVGDGRAIAIGSLANQLGLDDFDLTLNFEPSGGANAPPIALDLSSDRVFENSSNNTLVGVLTTTDPDAGDLHTYTLLDDAGGRFTLDGDRLLVADGTLLDFETDTVHTVTVRTTDSGGLSFTDTFDIQIDDIDETQPNQPPIDILIDPPSLDLAENSPTGTVFGTLDAIDPDGDAPLTFTLIDNAGGRFVLNGNQIVVADGSLLDFETTPSLDITVRVADPGGLSFDETIAVNLTDVPEPPTATDDTLSPTDILGTPDDDTLVYGELVRVSIPDSQLLANDSDPDGDTLQVVGAIAPFVGGLAFRDAALGAIVFEPDDIFFSTGSGQFGYLIDDNNGGTAAATVTVFGDAIATQDALGGNDVLVLTDPVAVDLSQTDDQTLNDTLTVLGFENVIGSPGDDTLGGDDNPNRLSGEAGNDSLVGDDGLDTLDGGDGDDIMFGEVQDLFFGGNGIDTIVIEEDSDNIVTVPIDVEVLVTGEGDDSIFGNVGDETIFSGDGDDIVSGELGDDAIAGGFGNDVLEGGSGADIFVFDSPDEGVDTLVDFEPFFGTGGGDRIFVSASGFGGGLTPGVLGSERFAFGAASDADDRFIFQLSTLGGALFYDPDGIGATLPIQIAAIPTTTFFVAEDIFVF
ncbi:Ig-like domain-containing protein [Baaleninema simplex]|uniref:Ig-like domain-containing protein n=1 Tax=Baaleninema simplex TaxID=2862350 RepID=UPI00034D7D07|nr:cadherin-like domain-containing protein [Baaleninema simplex]